MKRHSITLADLADWADGRLDAEAQRRVQAHLADGCPACQRDLAWLQRVIAAARTDQTVEPPGESVARVKDLYRSRFVRPAPQPRRLRLSLSPRLAVALAALPGFTLPGDISASERYYREDVIDPPVRLTPRGTIAVSNEPGAGITADETALARYAVHREELIS